MPTRCSKHILRALELAEQLNQLSYEGEGRSEDDGCAVLYGVVRDCAWRIRAEAIRELKEHGAMGLWNEKVTVAFEGMQVQPDYPRASSG